MKGSKNAAKNIATESYKVLREAEENQEKTCSKKNKLSKDTDSILQRRSTRKIPRL